MKEFWKTVTPTYNLSIWDNYDDSPDWVKKPYEEFSWGNMSDNDKQIWSLVGYNRWNLAWEVIKERTSTLSPSDDCIFKTALCIPHRRPAA